MNICLSILKSLNGNVEVTLQPNFPIIEFAFFLHFNRLKKMEDYKFLFKVVLIGEAGVGKTCLVRRFCQGIFPTGQAATIGVDFLIKTLEINGEKIKVKFFLFLKN